jgi:hypothetical protein
MGLLFLGDQREDFLPMIEEVAERVEDLGLGDAQRFGNFHNRFAVPMQRNDVADSHAQSIYQRLTAADAFETDDVRMLGLDRLGHELTSREKNVPSSTV